MTVDSNSQGTIDNQIIYHKQMEQLALRIGDFTKAEHHKKMYEILQAMRSQQASHKTPEQLSDEDYKVAPTSSDKTEV